MPGPSTKTLARLAPRLAVVLAAACSGASAAPSDGGPVLVLPDAGSGGSMPATSCGQGTSPRVGQTDCAPIGPTTCPSGFATSDSGWGCEAVQSAAPCTGTVRAQLGQTSCVAVDDCTAPFPPPGADVVVSQTAPAPAVSTIAAALAMVPEGGTIAIDAGTYSESVTLTQNVHLVGRCAATVIVDASGLRGVFASGFFSAELQSFTVNGGSGGIVAAGTNITASNMILLNNQIAVLAGYGGSVKLSSSLIDGGGQANSATSEDGAVTVSGGSQATLTDVEIRNFSPAVTAYQASSSVTLSRSLVSYMGPEASTSLVTAWTGSSVTVEESALSTLQAGLVYVGAALPGMSGDPASITFTSSELTQSGYNRQDISVAIGAGATAAFDQTTVHYQSSIGVFVSDQGSSAKLTGCALRGDPTFDVIREALEVGMGASAEIDDSAVVGAIQTALLVGDSGSSLTLQRDLVQGTTFVGPGPNSRLMGSGIAVGAGGETRLTMTDTSLVQNQQFGLRRGGRRRGGHRPARRRDGRGGRPGQRRPRRGRRRARAPRRGPAQQRRIGRRLRVGGGRRLLEQLRREQGRPRRRPVGRGAEHRRPREPYPRQRPSLPERLRGERHGPGAAADVPAGDVARYPPPAIEHDATCTCPVGHATAATLQVSTFVSYV